METVPYSLSSRYDESTLTLDASDMGLETHHMYGLVSLILQHDELKVLDLSDNFISYDGIRELIQRLQLSKIFLTKLVLSGNPLGPGVADLIGKYVQRNNMMQTLHLKNCMLGCRGIRVLCNYLDHHAALQDINLEGNKFKDGACIDMLFTLRTCGELQNVQVLAGNNCTNYAQDFINMLQMNRTVNRS